MNNRLLCFSGLWLGMSTSFMVCLQAADLNVSGSIFATGDIAAGGGLVVNGAPFASGGSVTGLATYGDNPSPWYIIQGSAESSILLIEANGDYSIQKQLIQANTHWETSDVKILARYEYKHKFFSIEYGLYGSGMASQLAIRLNPARGSATFMDGFTVFDLKNPSRHITITQVPANEIVRSPLNSGSAAPGDADVPFGGWTGINGTGFFVPANLGVGMLPSTYALDVTGNSRISGSLLVNGAQVVTNSGGAFSGGVTIGNDNNSTGGLTLGSGAAADGANLRLLSSSGQPQWNIDNSSGWLRFFTETAPGTGGVVVAGFSPSKAFRINDGRLELAGSGTYTAAMEMVGGGDEVLSITGAYRISFGPYTTTPSPHGKFNFTAGGLGINTTTNASTNIQTASAALHLEPNTTPAGGIWLGNSTKLYTPNTNQLNVQSPEPTLHVVSDGMAGPRDAVISAWGAGSGANSGSFQLIASHSAGAYGAGFHTTVGGTRTLSQTTQGVTIVPATASTSSTTGALVVVGGVGISGNTNINGNIAVNGIATKLRVAQQGDISMGDFTAVP